VTPFFWISKKIPVAHQPSAPRVEIKKLIFLNYKKTPVAHGPGYL
jgi:hypothetical protein